MEEKDKIAEIIDSPAPEAAPQSPAPSTPAYPQKPDNVVYVGKKGVMSYVLAVVTNFNNGSKEVIIKARGNVISLAVDVEEMVKHKFVPGVVVKDVRFSTEDLQSRDGRPSRVSSIEIVLTKP